MGRRLFLKIFFILVKGTLRQPRVHLAPFGRELVTRAAHKNPGPGTAWPSPGGMVRRIMRKVMRGNPYRIFDYARGYAQCYARLGNIMREGVFTARGIMREL